MGKKSGCIFKREIPQWRGPLEDHGLLPFKLIWQFGGLYTNFLMTHREHGKNTGTLDLVGDKQATVEGMFGCTSRSGSSLYTMGTSICITFVHFYC